MRRHFALAALIVCAARPAIGATPPTPEAKQAAAAMLQRFIHSWNTADGTLYKQNYWPEAELVDPTGHIVTGADAIAQEHVDLWEGPFKASRQAGQVRRIQMLGPDHMIVDIDLRLTGAKQAPPGGSLVDGAIRSHLKHVMEKRNGVWKVISAQNTFVSQ